MSGDSKASVGVILASVREGRRGAAFADWTMAQLGGRDDLEAQLLDLREWPLPPYAHAENAVAAERRYEADSLAGRWRDRIASMDAFVIVTCEYNHGYPGSLKNAMDTVYTPWNRKPVGFVSYGGFAAGARAVEQLRLVACELRLVPVRDEVNLSLVGLAADERGWPTADLHAKRATAMIGDLMWWTRVTRAGRAA